MLKLPGLVIVRWLALLVWNVAEVLAGQVYCLYQVSAIDGDVISAYILSV